MKKSTLRSALLFVALMLAVSPAFAAKKKGHPHPAPAPVYPVSPQEAQDDPSKPPSARLASVMESSLDKITAPLTQSVSIPTGRLEILRASFTASAADNSDPKSPQYVAALSVCDSIQRAIDERNKAVNNYQTSQTNHGVSDIKDIRKGDIKRGRGSGLAAQAEKQKEYAETKGGAHNALQADEFMSTASLKAWTDRSTQLRQEIQSNYAQLVRAEKAPAAAGAGS